MNPLLEVKDVCLSYHSLSGETAALSHISFHLMPEEFLAVVGPSGCGKSTLLNLICGLLHAESGTILMNGKPLNKDSARIGYMLQKDHLLEWRSIYRNVLLGLEIQGELTKDNLSYVDELLKIYKLDKFRDSRPSQLSGGMRQRAALIRTLALEPDLLLLDEPFSALDYQTRLSVCDDISSIIRSRKKTAILITHDLSEAVSAADRILVLTSRPGRIKGELLIRFPDHETSPLKRRNYPEFSSYFNELWRILGNSGEGDEMALDGNDRKYGGVPLKDENDGPKCGIGGGADEIS